MELSKRMKMNADMIDAGVNVADIGCDHGYVSIYLAKYKNSPKVVAMDVRKGPLSQAERNIAREGLSERITCRLSDGFEKLELNEVDSVLIAGMGGMLECKILTDYPEVTKSLNCLILQPQSDYKAVRKLVFELGFYIENENYCKDNEKPYIVMRCRKGQADKKYCESELAYGRMQTQLNAKEYCEYLQRQCNKYSEIINKLSLQETESSKERIEELTHELALMKEVIYGGFAD